MTFMLFSFPMQASVGLDELKASWFEHSPWSRSSFPVFISCDNFLVGLQHSLDNQLKEQIKHLKCFKFQVCSEVLDIYTLKVPYMTTLLILFVSFRCHSFLLPSCFAECNVVESREEFLGVKPLDWVDHLGWRPPLIYWIHLSTLIVKLYDFLFIKLP